MLLPTKQVAKKLGVHPATVRRWTACGRVRFVRIGRERAIPVAEVNRLLRARGIGTRNERGGQGTERTSARGSTKDPRLS